MQVNDPGNDAFNTKLSCVLQAAELLFGPAGRPHDYLQEALFRLLAVGFIGAASQNWILKVQHVMLAWYPAASLTLKHVISALTPSGAWSGPL